MDISNGYIVEGCGRYCFRAGVRVRQSKTDINLQTRRVSNKLQTIKIRTNCCRSVLSLNVADLGDLSRRVGTLFVEYSCTRPILDLGLNARRTPSMECKRVYIN